MSANTFAVDKLSPGIYYRQDGLERWFLLVDGTRRVIDSLRREYPKTSLERIYDVALALPPNSEGREVRAGFTTDPIPTVRSGNVMLFRTDSTRDTARVEVRYVVRPTAAQSVASNGIVKIVTLLVIPLLTLIMLPPAEISRPMVRRIAIGGGMLVQASLIAWVVWMALAARQAIGADKIVDIVIAIVGAIAEGIVLFVKRAPAKGK